MLLNFIKLFFSRYFWKKMQKETPCMTSDDAAEMSPARAALYKEVLFSGLPLAPSSMMFFRKNMLVSPSDGLFDANGRLMAAAFDPNNEHMFLVEINEDGTILQMDNASHGIIRIGSGEMRFIVRDLASACIINRYSGLACGVPVKEDDVGEMLKRFPQTRLISESLSGDTWQDQRTININTYKKTEVDGFKYKDKHFNTIQEYYEEGGDILTHLDIKPRFEFEPFWRMLKTYSRQKWLIEGLIPAAPSLTLLFSPSGLGKTFLILDFSLCIATGKGLWKGRQCQKGKVLYVCGEGKGTLVPRISAWCIENNEGNPRNVEFYAEDGPFDVSDPTNNEALLKRIEQYFAEEQPIAMVFDTMNLFMGDGDENSTHDANRFIHTMKEMTLERKCAIILVHHTGVSTEERARGSSVFKGALDSELRLERSKGTGVLVLTQTKSRYGKESDPINLELKEVSLDNWALASEDDGEKTETSCVVVQAHQDKDFEGALAKDVDFLVKACKFYGKTTLTKEEMLSFARNGEYNGPVAKDATIKLNKSQKGKTLWRLLENGILEDLENDSYMVADPIVINRIQAVDTAKE